MNILIPTILVCAGIVSGYFLVDAVLKRRGTSVKNEIILLSEYIGMWFAEQIKK